jgi:hypothetical protein
MLSVYGALSPVCLLVENETGILNVYNSIKLFPLGKVTVCLVGKKYPAFYGNRMFIPA